MNAKLDPTLIPAFDAIFGTDIDVARFKRLCAADADLRRFNSLPRAPSQPNPADTCGCGAEATNYDYSNGHVYGLCDECY